MHPHPILGGAGVESYPAASYALFGYSAIIFVREGEGLFEAGAARYAAPVGDLLLRCTGGCPEQEEHQEKRSVESAVHECPMRNYRDCTVIVQRSASKHKSVSGR